jgi:hypothetical protein
VIVTVVLQWHASDMISFDLQALIDRFDTRPADPAASAVTPRSYAARASCSH